MQIQHQILFFFSALGAFNGLFLSLYFGFFVKNRNRASYFLAALLFVVSVRVAKSVFLTFYPDTSGLFIQVGLTACFLIGPFLYLYVREVIKGGNQSGAQQWLWHILPVVAGMIAIGYFLPYWDNRKLWWRVPPGILGWTLFTQWLIYVLLAAFCIRGSFKKLFRRNQKIGNQDFWLLNVVIGVGIIWLAYNTSQYTSYIVGALSFSFTLYLTILIWVFKRRKSPLFFEQPVKYANKRINANDARMIETRLIHLFKEQAPYKDPQLKLSDVAQAIDESPHALSEYLNDNLGKSFSTFVNEYRVKAASVMLETNNQLTLEAIGRECGFKSNSSFYAAFKKVTGTTPARFKKALINQ